MIYSFDYCDGIKINAKRNGKNKNLILFKADINKIPIKENTFDKVICMGVLQHCKDPRESFNNLLKLVKPNGGEIVIDVYRKPPLRKKIGNLKYLLRIITKRIDPNTLYKIIRVTVPILLPIRVKIKQTKYIGRFLHKLIPINDHIENYGVINKEHLERSISGTFDNLSPRYENDQSLEDVKKWFKAAKLTKYKVTYGGYGIKGIGVK